MNESRWICERCGKEFDLEMGEGWVRLVEEKDPFGQLTSLQPLETVCYECADELHRVAEACDRDCLNCEVVAIWGLSIEDCLKFQLKFDLVGVPHRARPRKGSVEEAKEVVQIFSRHMYACER